MSERQIAVVLTCHNRRASTLACLQSVGLCRPPADTDTLVVVVDDGSTDGTAEAIQREYPHVELVCGSGDLYWNGGMRLAMEAALKRGCDFFLWLNDDTLLAPDALGRLLATYQAVAGDKAADALVVGSTSDPDTRETTYGGRVQRWRGLLREYEVLEPGIEPLQAETMNGNCVLVPVSVVEKIGSLDPAFTHGLGDYDYGLRARKAGIKLVVCPGYVGTCARNVNTGLPVGERASIKSQLAAMSDSKRLPYSEWLTFTRRHSPLIWPLHWLRPYAAAIMRAIAWKFRHSLSWFGRAIDAKRH